MKKLICHLMVLLFCLCFVSQSVAQEPEQQAKLLKFNSSEPSNVPFLGGESLLRQDPLALMPSVDPAKPLILDANTPILIALASAKVVPQTKQAGILEMASSQRFKAVLLYRTAWLVVNSEFLHRDQLEDWASWEHLYDHNLRNEKEAVEAIEEMLKSLKDPYTRYEDPQAVKASLGPVGQTEAVFHKMLPQEIGYIQVAGFDGLDCAETVEKAMLALDGAQGYILDLRGNPGGFEEEAWATFSLFVDKGTFVSDKGISAGKPYSKVFSVMPDHLEKVVNGVVKKFPRSKNLAGNKPLVVFVDGHSASAAEMLCGALKVSGRAKVLGSRTYGKGQVQGFYPLSNGAAISVTQSEYFLADGTRIHKIGLTPDVLVAASQDEQDIFKAGYKILLAK